MHYDRDGDNVRRSGAVLLLALSDSEPIFQDCGACGFATCNEMKEHFSEGDEFAGPLCAWRIIDLRDSPGLGSKNSFAVQCRQPDYAPGVVARKWV